MVDTSVLVARSYSTRGTKKKLLVEAMKASTSYTAKKRRLKKVVIVEGENVEVLKVGECEDIDLDIHATTEKRSKETDIEGRTRSYCSKSCSPIRIRQKHITIKKKKSFERPGPKKKNIVEKKPNSDTKI